MIMCERDQSFHWAYDLFRDPFASTGYYPHPNGYADGNYCDHHYPRGSPVECVASILCKSHEKERDSVPHVYIFGSADASHPDETHLHSSALTYDMYNPSVDMYHHGSENNPSSDSAFTFHTFASPP
jgi:hypothetical protein